MTFFFSFLVFLFQTVPVVRANHPNRIYPAMAASEYPTAGDVRKWISKFATSVDLREEHVADLLEVMVQDGDVERIFVKRVVNEDVDMDEDDDDADGMKNGKGKRKREDSGSDSDDDEDSKSRSKKKKLKTSKTKKAKKNGGKKIKKKKKSSSSKHDSDESDGEDESSEEDFDSDEDAEAALARKSSGNDITKKGGAKRKDRKRKRLQASDEDDAATSESSQDESEEDEDLKAKNKRMAREASTFGRDHVYRLTKPYTPRIGRTDMPCGPCPVESFCSEPSRALGKHHHQRINTSSNFSSRNGLSNGKKSSRGGELLGRPRVQISGGLDGVGMLGGVGAAVGASNEKWGDSGGRVGTGVAPVNPKTCDYMQNWLDF